MPLLLVVFVFALRIIPSVSVIIIPDVTVAVIPVVAGTVAAAVQERHASPAEHAPNVAVHRLGGEVNVILGRAQWGEVIFFSRCLVPTQAVTVSLSAGGSGLSRSSSRR